MKDMREQNATPETGEDAALRSRRDVLRAVGKYSAFLAGTSAVIMSADEVLAAPKPCSQIGGNGNGNGNGPGNGNGNGPRRCR